jgi:succinoglycan biosynthesis transport protein ExoP
MTAQDFVEIWKRRRWWFLGTTALLAATTCVVVGLWPSSYHSEALILIEQPAVSQDIVKPTAAIDNEQQISGLIQQVLSHTLLQRLPIFKTEQIVSQKDFDDLQQDFSIDIMRENTDPRRPAGKPYGLKVGFSHRTPHIAQEGANELAALVVQQADEMTLQQANETTGTLRSQLAVAETRVNQTSQALEVFKKQFAGQLPIEEQLTIETLARLQGQLEVNGQAIARARQTISDLQSTPDGDKSSTSQADSELARLETDLQNLKLKLAGFESRYKPNHPDVIKTREEIQHVEAQVNEQAAEIAASKASKPGSPNANLSPTLVARINEGQAEVAARQKEQDQVEQQIAHYQGNLGAIPLRAQQFTELEREYDAAKKNYETLRDEVSQAEQSADVYQQHEGIRYRIQDFATLPDSPDKPVRWKINSGGLGGALFVGLLLAAILELCDTSLKSDRDSEFYTGLKNLALIPDLPSPIELDRVRRNRSHWIIGTAVIAFVFAGINIYVYLVRL